MRQLTYFLIVMAWVIPFYSYCQNEKYIEDYVMDDGSVNWHEYFGVDQDYEFVKRNSLFLELGGPGVLYSINYERRVIFLDHLYNDGITISTGFTFFPASITGYQHVSAHHLRLCYTKQNALHRFNIGGHLSIISSDFDYSDSSINYGLIFGYIKSIRANDSFEWGISFTPFLRNGDENDFIYFGSLRFGYKL